MSLINPSVGIVLTSSTALLTSIAILLTNEFISKIKARFTKLSDSINVNTLLFEKTLRESMIGKKKRWKRSRRNKKNYNHSFDKRPEIMKSTQFKVEDVFVDVINKDSISTEQRTKNENKCFFSQIDVNKNITIKFNFFKTRKNKLKIYEPIAPPYYD